MHTLKVKRSNVIAQALLLFVVSPLKQIANSFLVASKSLLTLNFGNLGGGFSRPFLSGCFN